MCAATTATAKRKALASESAVLCKSRNHMQLDARDANRDPDFCLYIEYVNFIS